MRTLSIVGVTIINLLITARYCWLIWKQKIKPALAMWIFFTIAVVGSLVTFLSEGNYGLLDNILNTTDLALVGFVTTTIYLYGDKSTKFNRFDQVCLIAVLGIIAFWMLTQNHTLSHLSIQTILIMGYFPVVRRLWKSDQNTESFAAWIGMMLAPAIALFSSKGTLAAVYSLRAIVCILILLTLMIRAELRQKNKSANETQTQPVPFS